MTAGLTLVHVPIVTTVRQGNLSTPVPTAVTVQQQGSPFGACPLVENRHFVLAPFPELLPAFFEPGSEGDLIPAIPSNRE